VNKNEIVKTKVWDKDSCYVDNKGKRHCIGITNFSSKEEKNNYYKLLKKNKKLEKNKAKNECHRRLTKEKRE
jgi:hypothetical protein